MQAKTKTSTIVEEFARNGELLRQTTTEVQEFYLNEKPIGLVTHAGESVSTLSSGDTFSHVEGRSKVTGIPSHAEFNRSNSTIAVGPITVALRPSTEA